MPRRGRVKKREIPPDPIYKDRQVQKFINLVMRRGKKSLAERITYTTFQKIEERLQKPALEVFKKAIENVRPRLEVRPRRVGGATYQIPCEVNEERGYSLAMRWIISFAKAQKGKPMIEKLTSELINAYNNTGPSIKKRDDTHKMAEANRAFLHFRW
jgi:small subunit ribosomal protein S7